MMCNLHLYQWCTFCTGVTLELQCSQPVRIEYFFNVYYYGLYKMQTADQLKCRLQTCYKTDADCRLSTKCRLRIKTLSHVIHDNVIYMYVTAKESLWTLVADCRRIPYLQCTVAGNKKLKNSPSSKILYIKLTSSITASPLPWDFCGWTYLILESPLRTVPTFVSAHTFCASRKPWFKRALGLVLTQSTMPPSTWVMTKIKIFLLWPNLFWWNYA